MMGENKLKKNFILTMLAIVLMLVACNGNSTETGKDENADDASETNATEDKMNDKEQLTLQVLKADEEAGATIENHTIYNELNKLIQDNPDIGQVNDFSLYTVNTIHNEEGETKLVLLGINRLPMPIKNIAFDFTLGNDQGEYIWKQQEVTMSEDSAGTLQTNGAFPIILPLSSEQEELLKSLNEDNQVMEIENFKYEEA